MSKEPTYEETVPKVWPKTEEEMLTLIREQVEWANDYKTPNDGYNRTGYASANIALLAFRYAAHQFGITGFQAGYAAMCILREINSMKGPIGIIDGEKFLYPQYDLYAKLEEWHKDWTPTLSKMARGMLAKDAAGASPDVLARWKYYAELDDSEEVILPPQFPPDQTDE